MKKVTIKLLFLVLVPWLAKAQGVEILTYGFAPPIGFPDEVVAFRVDYLNYENINVYVDSSYSWFPLDLSMYRYDRDGELSHLIYYLKVPSIDADSIIVLDVPLHFESFTENKILYLRDTLFIKSRFSYYTIERRNIVEKQTSSVSGSWWMGSWGTRSGNFKYNTILINGFAVKDEETLEVPYGTLMWIYGLNSELVHRTLLKWPQGKFYIWVEGDLELYKGIINENGEGFIDLGTFLSYENDVKKINIEKYEKDTLEISNIPIFHYGIDVLSWIWNIICKVHGEGKIFVAFKVENVEFFRKSLNIKIWDNWNNIYDININTSKYVYKENYNIKYDIHYPNNSYLWIDIDNCQLYSSCSGLSGSDGYSYYAMNFNLKRMNENRFAINKIVKTKHDYTSLMYRDVTDANSDIISRGNFVYTISAGPAVLWGTDLISPPRRDKKYFILAQFIPDETNINFKVDYQRYWFGSLSKSENISENKYIYDYLDPKVSIYISINNDSIIYEWSSFSRGEYNRGLIPDYLVYYGKYQIFDEILPEPIERQFTVDLFVNPNVVKLKDLEETLSERPQVEIMIQVHRDSLPVSGLPIEIIGPLAEDPLPEADSPLWIPEPRQTDIYGHYAFYWTPPHRSWFADKELPYRFQFTVRVDGENYNLIVEVANLVITGRVWQRHAGALDGGSDKQPLPGVEVSLDPNFPASQTLRTGKGGYFELGVNNPGSYVVYARRPEYWEDGFPKWTRTQGTVQVEQDGPRPDTLNLYLAALPVGSLRRKWAASLQQALTSSREGAVYGAALAEALAYLDELSVQTVTDSLDEEAWRRLQLGLFSAYQTMEGALDLATCGVAALWDTYWGILLQIIDKLIDTIKLTKNLRDALQQRLRNLPPESPKFRQTQYWLKQLDELVAKTDGIVKRIRSKLEDQLKQIEIGISDLRKLSDPGALNTIRNLEFLRDRVYKPILNHLDDLDLLEAWKGASWNLTGWLTQWSARLNELLEGVREKLADGLLDGLRNEVSDLIGQEVKWARERAFPLYPLGYRDAHHASNGLLRELQQERQRLLGLCEGLQGLREQVGAALDVLNAAALGISAASGWTLAPVMGAVTTAANVATLVLSTAAGLHVGSQIGDAISRDGNYTHLGLGAMRKAFHVETGALAIRVHSPVHLLVVDRAGRRLGRGANGRYYDELPGGSYFPDFEEEGELIWLPAGIDSFQVWIQGVANGSYRLELWQAVGKDSVAVLKSWEGQIVRGALARLVFENGRVSDELMIEETPPTDVRLLRETTSIDTIKVAVGGSLRLKAEQHRQLSWIPLLGGNWTLDDSTKVRLYVYESELLLEGVHSGHTFLHLNLGERNYSWPLYVVGLETQVFVDSVVYLGQQLPVAVQLLQNGIPKANEKLGLEISGAFGKWTTQGTTDLEGRVNFIWTVSDTIGVGPVNLTIWHIADSTILESQALKVIREPFNQSVLEEEVYYENVLIGRLRVERDAWGNALSPILIAEAVALGDTLPWRLPAGYSAVSMGISFGLLDEASAEIIEPSHPLTIWIRGEVAGGVGLLWSGQNWQEIELVEENGWYRILLSSGWGIVVIARREGIVGNASWRSFPEKLMVEGPYPHPVRGQMQLRLGLPNAGRFRVMVYDVMGREVLCLTDRQAEAGWYELRWNVDFFANGLYLLVIESGDIRLSKPFIKIR